ncbi:peptidoglycan-recognition protein SB2-like isoform X2 [Maniola jurtina]|uniref:peptidoglycan-recognition protein SB2-like isoform X2 n=1 Tax=Maniola jurtina TaxID=191418 RepID=UPI001E68F4AE|nr:peptidoglycan-recognition protein SB2-like isoform X2 [Maniola jurtina]
MSRSDFDIFWHYNLDEDEEVVRNVVVTATEETPLLSSTPNNRNVQGTTVAEFTSIVVLTVSLLVGLSIGVYLLVLQYNQDHTVPPIENFPAFHINKSEMHQPGIAEVPKQPFHANTVIIEQTGTAECSSSESCVPVLQEIKGKFGVNNSVPYNFLVASDGTAYKGLGWSKLSPLHPELKPLSFAFIGNFAEAAPAFEQIGMTKSLISDFLEKDLLIKNYTIRGDLFDKFKDAPEWKKIKSGYLYSL